MLARSAVSGSSRSPVPQPRNLKKGLCRYSIIFAHTPFIRVLKALQVGRYAQQELQQPGKHDCVFASVVLLPNLLASVRYPVIKVAAQTWIRDTNGARVEKRCEPAKKGRNCE